MNCPFCNVENSKVIDSRLTASNKIRRRRECHDCNKRFSTYEQIEYSYPVIIKSDKSRELFDLNKVKNGISKALEKRPVSAEQLNSMLAEIETALQNIAEKEILSSVIGELIMNALKKVDLVAYVRFASVYCSFQDINAFSDEINSLKKLKT